VKFSKQIVWLLVVGGLTAFPASRLAGQESGDAGKPAEDAAVQEEAVADSVESVAAEWREKYSEFLRRYRAAAADERPAIQAEMPKINEYVERMQVLAEADIAGEDGKKALLWILQNDRGEAGRKATDLLIEHHIDAPEMADVAMSKTRETPTVDSLAFLDTLSENGSSDRVRGLAAYARAMQLRQGYSSWTRYEEMLARAEGMSEEEVAAQFRGLNLERIRQMVAGFRDSLPAEVSQLYADPDTYHHSIETAFEKIIADFGSVKLRDVENSPTLGERLESELFEIKYLAVGCEAPNISGEDIDGVEFNLTDYRGKVVVIDFWGDW
jgi:uncharacterized protein (DUF305 family)